MQNKLHYDVVIIGAGLVGLTAALALSLNNFSIAVIEAQPKLKELPSKDSPIDTKVVAITRASEHFFRYLGVWEQILGTRHCAYEHMTVWDNAQDGIITFSAVDFFEENLGHIIEQKVIIGALVEALKSKNDVHFFMGKTVSQSTEGNVLLDDGTLLQAALQIGADGANSALRVLKGIPSTHVDYEQIAIVATIRCEKSHNFTAYQRFEQDGPLALLPLAEEHLCSIVWTTSNENAQKIIELSPEDFGLKLTHESSGILGQLTLASAPIIFPLSSHHAQKYVLPGYAFIGDAAHTVHPLAGLGVNMGILDVASLVEVLICVKKGASLGSEKVLKRYERQRKMHNQLMIWAMRTFKEGFGSQNILVQQLRNTGLNWVNKHTSIKQFFAKMAMGTLGPIPSLATKNGIRTVHAKKDAVT